MRTGTWSDCLPPLRIGNEAIGTLRTEIAEELGLPAGIPVAIGGGDNMMGAIGTGNVRPGMLTMSLGTSGTVYAYADRPVVDPEGNIAAFCSSTGGWLPLLCTMNCTVSTELMRSLLNADISAFEEQVAAAGAGRRRRHYAALLQRRANAQLAGCQGLHSGESTAVTPGPRTCCGPPSKAPPLR